MRSFKILLLVFICFAQTSIAQNPMIITLDSGRAISIRGLSVVNDDVLWCSGNKGTVGKSTNGGKSFIWLTIGGYEQRDFRDIEAFNANTALVMAIAEPAVILKTIDGGKNWKNVFEDSSKGMFLDAMDFDKKGNGSVIGDPIDGKLYQIFTKDYGNTWIVSKSISLNKGEAFFASSGTNIQSTRIKKQPYIFASGGMISRIFFKEKFYQLELQKGKETTGANSIAVHKRRAVIVGGNFVIDNSKDSNCVLVNLNGNPHFSIPQSPPFGYRSCVIYLSRKKLVCCGTSGVDVSFDGGKNWKNISTQSFHVVQKSKNGKHIFLAGTKGKIAKLSLK